MTANVTINKKPGAPEKSRKNCFVEYTHCICFDSFASWGVLPASWYPVCLTLGPVFFCDGYHDASLQQGGGGLGRDTHPPLDLSVGSTGQSEKLIADCVA